MSLLTIENTEDLNAKCKRALQVFPIRFAGIINKKGHLVSGGFKTGIIPYEEESKLKMLHMQTVLDFSMRSEYNDTLGGIFYVVAKREKVTTVTIPLGNELLLLLSCDPNVEIESAIINIQEMFRTAK